MNTKLLNQIALAILEEPTRFDMGDSAEHDRRSTCGTTACIAGYAVAFNRSYKKLALLVEVAEEEGEDKIRDEAMEAIGLTFKEAERLFFRWNWPSEFKEYAYCDDISADNAFWRIQHFIATEGRE